MDAAVNSQYLEFLMTQSEAQRGRLMFAKQCEQERWEVSKDRAVMSPGVETCTQFAGLSYHQKMSVDFSFRT